MSDWLPGYDAWKTAAPEEVWYACPECGCSQEDADFESDADLWVCPCGHEYTEEDAIRAYEDAREDAVLGRADL